METVGSSRMIYVTTHRTSLLTDGTTRCTNRTHAKDMRRKVEAPCEVDEGPCLWIAEETYTRDGDLLSDAYCEKCFRSRDWGKDEYKP